MGDSTVSWPITALGSAAVTGAASVVSNFETFAEAILAVTYNYTAAELPPVAVPEPI